MVNYSRMAIEAEVDGFEGYLGDKGRIYKYCIWVVRKRRGFVVSVAMTE